MSYPQTYVDHRNPDHHESIHPTRNIANAHVVAGEFLTSRYHDALPNCSPSPRRVSGHQRDQHALNDLGIVHANGSLNELSPIVRTYVKLDEYWTRTHSTALNELFADRRAHVLSCCTRFLSEFPSPHSLKPNLAVPELRWILPLLRFSSADFSRTQMMRKPHTLLMNTTRYIDRLNDSSTHFLTKQLFSGEATVPDRALTARCRAVHISRYVEDSPGRTRMYVWPKLALHRPSRPRGPLRCRGRRGRRVHTPIQHRTWRRPPHHHERGFRRIDAYHWGLIPFWADEPGEGIINARSETADEKRVFERAWNRAPASSPHRASTSGKHRTAGPNSPTGFTAGRPRVRDGRPLGRLGG